MINCPFEISLPTDQLLNLYLPFTDETSIVIVIKDSGATTSNYYWSDWKDDDLAKFN